MLWNSDDRRANGMGAEYECSRGGTSWSVACECCKENLYV